MESTLKNIDMLLERAKQKKDAVVAVAVAEDEHVLEAVDKAYKLGIARFILVGNEQKINEKADNINISLTGHEVVNRVDNLEAVNYAVRAVSAGRATALMKGLIDTSVIMKQAMNREFGLRTGKTLSHLAVFEVPTYHKLFFITDAALNIAPDLDVKKDIVENAVTAVQKIGVPDPKVALLCAKEKVDEKMPVTLEYEKLVQMNRAGAFSSAIVDGPFALDNAISKESAEIKGIDSLVAGDADILVCPDIEAGNILYKSLTYFSNARNGGVIIGAKAPIILTSRADSSESKLLSLALAVM